MVATKAKLAGAKSATDYGAALSAIDQQEPGDETDTMRYDFWYEIDDEHVVEVFQGCEKWAENFTTILQLEDEDRDFSLEIIKSLSEYVLEKEPKNPLAHYQMGVYYEAKNDFVNAKKHLKQTKETYPEDGVYYHPLKSRLVLALYETGDDSLVEFAKENKVVGRLLKFKKFNNDFSNTESLIELLDKDSPDYAIHSARLEYHKGNHEQAIESICDQLKEQDEEDNNNYFYEFNELLIELSKAQGNPYDAFDRAPNQQLWDSLSRRALRTYDWKACKQLLESTDPEFELHRARLQQAMFWRQGEYAKVLEYAPEIVSWEKRLHRTESDSNEDLSLIHI